MAHAKPDNGAANWAPPRANQVLLVGQKPTDRQSIDRSLGRKGDWEIHHCASGAKALAQWGGRLSGLDVVICGHRLADMSGREFCRLMLERPQCPALVVLSPWSRDANPAEFLALGVSEYLLKDREGAIFAVLPQVLGRSIRLRRLERENRTLPEGAEDGLGRALWRHLPWGAAILDRERRVMALNPAAREMLGTLDETWRGKPCEQVLTLDLESRQYPWDLALDSGRPLGPVECNLLLGRGHLPLETVALPLEDCLDAPAVGAVLFRDITDRLAVEQERCAQLSMMVHDMKTPLLSVKSFARRLAAAKEEVGAQQRRRFARVILRETGGLEKLVLEFLRASREAGTVRLRLNLRVGEVGALLQQVRESLAPVAHSRNMAIRLEIPGQPLWALMDADRLRRAVTNLVGNALDHSTPGAEVVVRALDNGYECVLEVEDHGEGMDQADLPHIFRPYYRGRAARGQNGFGLGLAGVKAIVEGHGGGIQVASHRGHGSLFTLLIPLAEAGDQERAI